MFKFIAPNPLWSCCWAGDNTNVLFVGDDTGFLHGTDRRYMNLTTPMKRQKSGCVSLNTLPPSTSRSFSRGGILKTRMNCLSIIEQCSCGDHIGYSGIKFPLKGHWSSSSYDCQSNLLLISSIPFGSDKLIRHMVFKLTIDINTPVTSVVTFYG